MMKKLVFGLGLAAGYVLGTRAGRERYEQISAAAKNVWYSDQVQDAIEDAGETVKQVAPKIGEVAQDGVKQASKLVGGNKGKSPFGRGAKAPSGTAANPAN